MGDGFLLENVGWVLLTNKDKSQRKIITTMNREILESFEVKEFYEDKLFDLHKKEWIDVEDVIDAEVYEDEPKFTQAVDLFMEDFLCK